MRASTPKRRGLGPMSNAELAVRLDEVGGLLESQGANPFRVRAYRAAAETLRGLRRPAVEILDQEGREGLSRLPGIGRSLAAAIEQMERTGRLALLDRLRGEDEPERRFASVADVGPQLARRIHDVLGIETLGELEAAAYDGRLATVPGMGPKRIRAVRESLAGRFRRRVEVPSAPNREPQPDVAELLDVDSEYRRLAELDRLPRVAPRRFNPTGAAWLPILHTEREDRHYTVLFSNTAKAHEMGTTGDWVVIYLDDHVRQGQWTVITSHFGSLRNRRIVRGREADCAEYYRRIDAGGPCDVPGQPEAPDTDQPSGV